MQAKKFEKQNLETINAWWNHYDYGAMPFEAFPKNTFLVFDRELPIVVGSVYMTDTKLCYMDNIVANPKSNSDQREAAMKVLLDSLTAAARKQGKLWWSAHSALQVMGNWSKQYKETQRAEGHYWFTGEL